MESPAVAAPGRTRTLALQGARNFRDIGGYPTDGGQSVRWGRVFRSNELSKLTAADIATIEALGVASVIDLRTAQERNQSPSAWAPADIYGSPKDTLASVMRAILMGAETLEGARASMTHYYSQIPDVYRDEFAAMFGRVLSGKSPILVHCTAGKDRTGVAIALLLASVDVPRATIIKDYALTETLVPAAGAADAGHAPVGATRGWPELRLLPKVSIEAFWGADPDYIQSALDSIDHKYGSIGAYLDRGLGISATDITRLREVLVE